MVAVARLPNRAIRATSTGYAAYPLDCRYPNQQRRKGPSTVSSLNPHLETTARLGELTGTELDRAHAAADYLLSGQVRERITDLALLAKLASLRDDLRAEQDERHEIARQ